MQNDLINAIDENTQATLDLIDSLNQLIENQQNFLKVVLKEQKRLAKDLQS